MLRGDAHAIVDTVTDDPERESGGTAAPAPAATIGALRAASAGTPASTERVADELRSAPPERPEPLPGTRDPHHAVGADAIGVDDRAASGRRATRPAAPSSIHASTATAPKRARPGNGERRPAPASAAARRRRRGAAARRPARRVARRAARPRAARRARPRAPRRPCAERGRRRSEPPPHDAARRARAAAPASAAASSGVVLGRERVEQLVVVAQHLGLAGEHLDEVAVARRVRGAGSPRGAATPAGGAARRSSGRAPAPSPSRAQISCVSARRSPSSGRRTRPRTRRHPREARRCRSPATARSSTVSAWSSRVCPTRIAAAPTSSATPLERGVARVACPRFEVRHARRRRPSTTRASAPTAAAAARTTRASCSVPARSPWSTYTATTSRSRAHGEREQRERIGAARAADDDARAGREVVDAANRVDHGATARR